MLSIYLIYFPLRRIFPKNSSSISILMIFLLAGFFLYSPRCSSKFQLHSEVLNDFWISWKLLDHNGDKKITIFEASAGLVPLTHRISSADTSSNLNIRSITSEDICRNVLPDSPMFIDCVVSKSRTVINGSNPLHELHFLKFMDYYLESISCDDLFPPENHLSFRSIPKNVNSCHELTKRPVNSAIDNMGCDHLVNMGFCRFTCRSCTSVRSVSGIKRGLDVSMSEGFTLDDRQQKQASTSSTSGKFN